MGPGRLAIQGALHAGGETEALGELQALPTVEPAIVSVNAHTHMCRPYCSGASGLQLSHLFSVPDPLPPPPPSRAVLGFPSLCLLPAPSRWLASVGTERDPSRTFLGACTFQ